MDVDDISSPVDPEPKTPSPILAPKESDDAVTDSKPDTADADANNDVNTRYTDSNTVTKPSYDDILIDDDEIDNILRQNQKFIEEHSIDPFLEDIDEKTINDLIDEDNDDDNNSNKEIIDEPQKDSEVVENGFVLKQVRELNNQLRGELVINNNNTDVDKNVVISQDTILSHSPHQPQESVQIEHTELDKSRGTLLQETTISCSDSYELKTSIGKTEITEVEKSSEILQEADLESNNNSYQLNASLDKIEAEVNDSFDIPLERSSPRHQDDIMAEPPTSSSPTSCAECKYRWSKVVESSSPDIGFYPSYSKGDPILLSWDSALKAYYSIDQKIVCGDYHGNLVIDGNVFPVDQFNIRSYTFEVDLFIKEDVSEEEVEPVQDKQSVEDFKKSDSNMDTLSKDETSVSNTVVKKSEISEQQSTEDFITSITSSLFENSSKRHSPVGDDAVKTYSEFSPVKNGTNEPLNKSWNSHDNINMKEDVDKRPSSRNSHDNMKEDADKRPSSRNSSQSGKQNKIVDDILVDNTPVQDVSRISYGSVHSQMSEERDGRNLRSSAGPSPVHSSTHNSLRDSPSVDAIYRRPPSNTSDRYSPVRSGRPGSDVDCYDKEEQRASSSHSRITPTRDVTPTLSSARPPSDASIGRERLLENGDHVSGNRPPSHPGSRHSSNHSSRPQSITSEQELGQYMGHGSRSSSIERSGTPGANGHVEEFHSHHSSRHSRESDRPTSVSSYSQQQQQQQSQLNSEVRSLTPDNRIRVPQSPDFTRAGVLSDRLESESRNLDRASVLSNAGSRASSRTITPSFSDRENLAPPHVKDLEDTVANLRKLLTKREAEVHSLNAKISDLKDINRSLQEDLEHAKRHRVGTSEDTILELKQTVAEKEILATEVVSLRDELHRLRGGSGRRSTSSEISDYSPNNPTVLQRKIVDLESHMRDLQEAHESATSKLGKSESKIRGLQDENKDLKSRSLSINDLQEVGGHSLRVELMTLREDLRSLKERNFQLTEENLRLGEGMKSKDGGSHSETKLNSSIRSDDGVLRHHANSHYREKSYRPSYSNYENRSSLSSQYKTKREDLAPPPKDLKHDSSYTSDRKHHDTSSSSRPLLQRESIEQSRLRYSQKNDNNINTVEASRSSSMLYSDRSRPDGEISEKLQSQRVSDLSSSSYDRKYLSMEKSPRQHSINLRDFKPRDYSKEDRLGDSSRLLADRYSGERPERDYSSQSRSTTGSTLNSKEIFFNLKQKRANQWLQQVDSEHGHQDILNTSADSENTDTLVAVRSLDGTHRRTGRGIKYINVNGVYDKYVSGNLESHQRPLVGQGHRDSPRALYGDDVADDSDTATDILLAQDGSGPRETSHMRVTSPGSDESLSSLSDGENGDPSRLRRRSKSVEFRRGQESSSARLLRSGSATRPLNSLEPSRTSGGLRSVLPTPLVTQHNKPNLSSSTSSLLNSTLTQGMRPFAPCNPSDVRSGDVVKFSRVGGKLTQGVVKYVGHLPGRSDAYLGVELDKDEGKHDGTFEDIRYFKCKPSKGVFVAFNKIVMAWAP